MEGLSVPSFDFGDYTKERLNTWKINNGLSEESERRPSKYTVTVTFV
jgi:hypothetical protein